MKLKRSNEDNYQKFLLKSRMIEYDKNEKKKSPSTFDDFKRGKSFSGVISNKFICGIQKKIFKEPTFKICSGIELSQANDAL